MEARAVIGLWLLLACPASVRAASTRVDLYLEQVYLSRTDQTSTSARIRPEQPLSGPLSATVTLGTELQDYGDGRLKGPGDSYVYGAPGLLARFGSLTVLTEVRGRYFPDSRSRDPRWDGRVLLVHGAFLEGRPLAPSLRPFAEWYGEGLYTSADRNNLIFSGLLRGGLRASLAPAVDADLYLEPFAVVDRLRHYYYNRSDLKVTLRLQLRSGATVVGLQSSLIANTYFRRGTYDVNPFRANAFGGRVLFYVGGVW